MNPIRFIDLLSGKKIAAYYDLYLRSQWYSQAELETYRIHKLKGLLRHCSRHVPFYQEIIRRKGLDVERLDSLDILQELPITDKETVKANYDGIVSTNLRDFKNLRTQQTGGTTGNPLRFYTDIDRRSSAWAAFYRFYTWMKIDLREDPKLVVWGAPIVARSRVRKWRDRVLDRLENRKSLDSFLIGRGAVDQLIARFQRVQPKLVRGYCQSVYELAGLFGSAGFRYPLTAVSTTVEPLFDEYRERFREVFGCETFDQYGCGEVEAIAFECEAHQGLHLTEERCVVEIEPDGEILVTDLDNRVFPFIRYRTGDRVVASERPRCACGRNGRMLEKIVGRSGDVVIGLKGTRLHPEFFTHLLNETEISFRKDVTRYQVIQRSADRLEWRIVSRPLDPEEEGLLRANLEKYLGKMRVEITVVEAIPESRSGKFRYVINEARGGGPRTAPPTRAGPRDGPVPPASTGRR